MAWLSPHKPLESALMHIFSIKVCKKIIPWSSYNKKNIEMNINQFLNFGVNGFVEGIVQNGSWIEFKVEMKFGKIVK
jgi:hypothetical protein